MKTIVLGAGIIGISTAWHLLERGHEVIVVDRQSDAAQETSFANAAQISVSYCEPWANREAPWKALKWMFDKEAPLLYRPQLDPQQWRWCLQFLAQCNDAAFERNVAQLVALGAYSPALSIKSRSSCGNCSALYLRTLRRFNIVLMVSFITGLLANYINRNIFIK